MIDAAVAGGPCTAICRLSEALMRTVTRGGLATRREIGRLMVLRVVHFFVCLLKFLKMMKTDLFVIQIQMIYNYTPNSLLILIHS